MGRLLADFVDLLRVSRDLTHARVYALGLDVDVHDWDVTTDAEERRVYEAVRLYGPKPLRAVRPYVSRYAYRLGVGSSAVDLLGGFAVEAHGERVALETRITGYFQGVPLGSAAEWAKLYRALGETEKAASLERIARRSV